MKAKKVYTCWDDLAGDYVYDAGLWNAETGRWDWDDEEGEKSRRFFQEACEAFAGPPWAFFEFARALAEKALAQRQGRPSKRATPRLDEFRSAKARDPKLSKYKFAQARAAELKKTPGAVLQEMRRERSQVRKLK
jgi:hypothetical protein